MRYEKCSITKCRKKANAKNKVRIGKDEYTYCDACFKYSNLYWLIYDDAKYVKRVEELVGEEENEKKEE